MLPIQKFCLENIYCSPSQDRQYFFSLVRVNNKSTPVKSYIRVFNVVKNLPDATNFYHVFLIGNLFPEFLNLILEGKKWFKDTWINFEEDSKNRNILIKVYDDKGIVYPSSLCYYSFIDENSILIAVRKHSNFNLDNNQFLRVYSNNYFTTNEFLNSSNQIGIDITSALVTNNVEKVALQNYISSKEQYGGKCLIFVNGYYTEYLSLAIDDGSYIEVIYDQSIVDVKEKLIEDLRTFSSVKDSRVKYLFFTEKQAQYINYYDDNDFFILTSSFNNNTGLYFYRHKDFVIRNVTDKDYSLDSIYVNNQATYLSSIKGGGISDKKLVCIFRKAGITRELKYSLLKLHEFYKLNYNKQLNVMLGTGHTHPMFRVENLENSNYFKLASENLFNITKELCTDTLGYNAITYYYGNNIQEFGNTNFVNVPTLYLNYATAFEYDASGKLLGYYNTTDPIYTKNNNNAKYVEFIYGVVSNNFSKLYNHNDTFTLEHNEFKIIEAVFSLNNPITNWVDITDDTNKVTINNNQVTLNLDSNKKAKVIYFNRIRVYDIQLELNDGMLYFPLTIREERTNGLNEYPLDLPFLNIELYLNGYKLTYGLDYFIDLPYVSICNKRYLDYTKQYQDLHVRAYGFNIDNDRINVLESKGFVNHGVLLRNNVYDVRDDRIFAIYIDGKLYKRQNVIYAEDDNTVRINNPLNGLSYVIKEPFISIKEVTGLDTYSYFNQALNTNLELSNFFNLVLPEPEIEETNVISDHHYLFSPLVSRLIVHLKTNVIPQSYYQNATDQDVVNLIDNTDEYKKLLLLDPTRYIENNNIVEIHPHLGNTVIDVNIFQYRFLEKVIRLYFNNRINLSGYVTVSV